MKYLVLFVLFFALPFCSWAQTLCEHTVSTGETLQSIGSKYGVSISELRNANPGLDDYLLAGMVLKLPSKRINSNDGSVIPLGDLKDIIYLKDGSELVAKIISVEINEVKFEQYDTDDTFTIAKNEIASIKFEDGRVSDFSVQQKKKTTTPRRSTKRTTR